MNEMPQIGSFRAPNSRINHLVFIHTFIFVLGTYSCLRVCYLCVYFLLGVFAERYVILSLREKEESRANVCAGADVLGPGPWCFFYFFLTHFLICCFQTLYIVSNPLRHSSYFLFFIRRVAYSRFLSCKLLVASDVSLADETLEYFCLII